MNAMVTLLWKRLDARPHLRDAVAAAAYFVIGVLLLALGTSQLPPADTPLGSSTLASLLTLAVAACVATQRSRFPIAALVVVLPVAVIDVLFGGGVGVLLIVFDLVYCVVKYSTDRQIRVVSWCAFVVIVATGLTLLIARPDRPIWALLALQWVLVLSTAASWGWNVRSERLRTSSRLRRVHERETAQLRDRIARDLHDLVANQIAVAGLHIEAARLRSEQQHTPDLTVIHSLERASQGTYLADRQLRRFIAVLHAVDDLQVTCVADITSSIAELDEMLPGSRVIAWQRDARWQLEQQLNVAPESTRAAVLRVLRELVANAAKHGAGDVSVSARGSTLTFENVRSAGAALVAGNGIGISGANMLLAGSGVTLSSVAHENTWVATVHFGEPDSGEVRQSDGEHT